MRQRSANSANSLESVRVQLITGDISLERPLDESASTAVVARRDDVGGVLPRVVWMGRCVRPPLALQTPPEVVPNADKGGAREEPLQSSRP